MSRALKPGGGAGVVIPGGVLFLVMTQSPRLFAQTPQGRWKEHVRQGIDAYRQRNFSAAEDAFRAALSEALSTRAHADVVQTLNWLGQAVQQQGRLPEAESLYRQALSAAQRVYGATDGRVLGPLTRLALFFFGAGQYGEARTLYERALVIASTTSGVDGRLVDTYLGALAEMDLFQGRYPEAEASFRRRLVEQDRRGRRTTYGEPNRSSAWRGRCTHKVAERRPRPSVSR